MRYRYRGEVALLQVAALGGGRGTGRESLGVCDVNRGSPSGDLWAELDCL